jgi:hypothetical protein
VKAALAERGIGVAGYRDVEVIGARLVPRGGQSSSQA